MEGAIEVRRGNRLPLDTEPKQNKRRIGFSLDAIRKKFRNLNKKFISLSPQTMVMIMSSKYCRLRATRYGYTRVCATLHPKEGERALPTTFCSMSADFGKRAETSSWIFAWAARPQWDQPPLTGHCSTCSRRSTSTSRAVESRGVLVYRTDPLARINHAQASWFSNVP